MLSSNNTFFASFLKGFSSALDLCPKVELPERFKHSSLDSPNIIDSMALKNDWEKVEQDLKNAMIKYENSAK